jgi:hypothetical protein
MRTAESWQAASAAHRRSPGVGASCGPPSARCTPTGAATPQPGIGSAVACFPQGDVHVLASEAGLEPLRITAEMVAGMAQPGSISRYRHRGKEVKTRLICGFFACDRTLSDQLIAPLPRLLTFEAGVDPASLLAASAQAAAGDGGVAVRPGSQAILCKLSELLFVDARLIRWRRPIGRSKRSLPTPGLALRQPLAARPSRRCRK